MRKLQDIELMKRHMSQTDNQNLQYAVIEKLSKNNMGVISPEHIAADLLQLKIKAKGGSTSLLNEAISLYEGYNGRIRLFNLGTSSAGRSPIPIHIPFTIAMARNRAMESDPTLRPTSPAVFMNMYRIGNWNADETEYIGLSAITDLYAELESGLVMYKMLVDGRAGEILSKRKIVEPLVRIYTFMFNKAVIKSARAIYGSADFMNSAAEFLIANFFLRYILGMTPSDTLDDYALSAVSGNASLVSLKDFEMNAGIDYTSLTGFLSTFGTAIYSEEIGILKFQTGWLTTFGEGLLYAIEYLPFLIHYLIACVRGASLGGNTRLAILKPPLVKKGLDVFYRTLVSELR